MGAATLSLISIGCCYKPPNTNMRYLDGISDLLDKISDENKEPMPLLKNISTITSFFHVKLLSISCSRSRIYIKLNLTHADNTDTKRGKTIHQHLAIIYITTTDKEVLQFFTYTKEAVRCNLVACPV